MHGVWHGHLASPWPRGLCSARVRRRHIALVQVCTTVTLQMVTSRRDAFIASLKAEISSLQSAVDRSQVNRGCLASISLYPSIVLWQTSLGTLGSVPALPELCWLLHDSTSVDRFCCRGEQPPPTCGAAGNPLSLTMGGKRTCGAMCGAHGLARVVLLTHHFFI